MIVNHDHKFIFVHIHKTAGSSVKNSLLKSVPNTYYLGYDHSFIKEIGFERYSDYFKFGFVRNPWERLVSWYFSILGLRSNNTLRQYVDANSKNFKEFLRCTDVIQEEHTRYSSIVHNNDLLIENPYLPYPKSISFNQLDYISDSEGKVAVDYIGRFENLHESWNFVCDKLRVNIPLRTDKLGSWHVDDKGNRISYRSFYEPEDRELVESMYKRDLDYFGYTF